MVSHILCCIAPSPEASMNAKELILSKNDSQNVNARIFGCAKSKKFVWAPAPGSPHAGGQNRDRFIIPTLIPTICFSQFQTGSVNSRTARFHWVLLQRVSVSFTDRRIRNEEVRGSTPL